MLKAKTKKRSGRKKSIQALKRKEKEGKQSDSSAWKYVVAQESTEAIEVAATHGSAEKWLAADAILAKLGERFPSIALPSEFARFLFVRIPAFPRELCLIVSSYTVDVKDAAADGLERAAVARAYCLTAGNGNEADASWFRRSVLLFPNRNSVTIEDLMFRLFHTQRYEACERVAEELLDHLLWQNPQFNRVDPVRVIFALCTAFRGDLLSLTERLNQINKLKLERTTHRLWLWLAEAWRCVLLNGVCDWEVARSYVKGIKASLERGMFQFLSVDHWRRRILPFAEHLHRYLQNPTTTLAEVHDAAVSELTSESCFPSRYPRRILDGLAKIPKPKFPLLY